MIWDRSPKSKEKVPGKNISYPEENFMPFPVI